MSPDPVLDPAPAAAYDPSLVVLVLVAVAVIYALSGLIWPYTACKACSGGKHHSPGGEHWRDCRRCSGSGKRLRLLARLLGRDT